MKIAFDIKLMRPGCVLLQAALGCNSKVAYNFNSTSWLLVPTSDLKVYEISEEQLTILEERVNKRTEKE